MTPRLYLISMILMVFMACKTETKKDLKPDIKKEIVAKSLYTDLSDNPIKLSDYKGKKILLNFWASWCVPCIQEMPAMLKAQNILEKENYIFLLASDESIEKILRFKNKTQYNFNFIKFTGALAQQNIYVLTTTIIYNEKGEKIEKITGAVKWDSKEMIDKLKNLK